MLGAAFAVPAKRTVIVVTQPDGTKLSILLKGDEWFHYVTTVDGHPLVKNHKGAYVYAVPAVANGVSASLLQPTDILAHNADERTAEEQAFFRTVDREAMLSRLSAERAERNAVRHAARIRRLKAKAPAKASTIGEGVKVTGKKKGLIILVQYKDTPMKTANAQQVFNDMANKDGYNENGHIGSVRDYFRDQSYGKFDVSFDVVGPYTVSQNMAYYGGNDDKDNDKKPGQLIVEACQLADPDVNYKEYDWNNDGEVDQVYVVYAGYSEAASNISDVIWPHQWHMSAAPGGQQDLQLDGMKVDAYACSSELDGDQGNVVSGIGVICHEFSHCLGLPDFYDTSGGSTSNFGMDVWSLMDRGCYNNDGRTPCAYTAYERAFSGWLDLIELNAPTKVTDLPAITDEGKAYVIYNDAHRNECYILDNHQNKGWDTHIMGSGLMITHVDFLQSAWDNNEVNNDAKHQRCTLIPADGILSDTFSSLTNDLYPGYSGNTSLTDTSSPAAVLYNANVDGRKRMGKPITNIKEEGGLISFDFMGGVFVPVPTNVQLVSTPSNSLTASWSAVANAVSYDVELVKKNTEDLSAHAVDVESFDKITTPDGGDSSKDMGKELDKHFSVAGWTGLKIYASDHRLKIGTAKVQGQLTSPNFQPAASGEVCVALFGSDYQSKTAQVTVSILRASDGSVLESKTATLGKDSPVLVNVKGINEAYKVDLKFASRIYLTDLNILNKNVAIDQLPLGSASGQTIVAQAEGITATSHTFNNLVAGDYQARVRARTADGVSAWSSAVDASVLTSLRGVLVTPEVQDGVYDLTGRRVQHPVKGVYIVNGKKQVVR